MHGAVSLERCCSYEALWPLSLLYKARLCPRLFWKGEEAVTSISQNCAVSLISAWQPEEEREASHPQQQQEDQGLHHMEEQL